MQPSRLLDIAICVVHTVGMDKLHQGSSGAPRVSFALSSKQLEVLDRAVDLGGYPSRSAAIRTGIGLLLAELEKQEELLTA